MKMPVPQPARPRTPPKDTRIREELRAHQRKLETLERNTLSMMSRSLASLSTATASASTIPVPTAPVYEPPKPSAKVATYYVYFVHYLLSCLFLSPII